MAKEKNATVKNATVRGATGNPWIRELFQFGIYKRSQGRIARQVTFAVLAVVLLLGAWRLSLYEVNSGRGMQFYLPSAMVALGLWVAFRLVNIPAFADFLIAVEAEMNKVSWPTRRELLNSSLVVIFCIFFLAAVLYAYDFFWRFLLVLLKVIDVSS